MKIKHDQVVKAKIFLWGMIPIVIVLGILNIFDHHRYWIDAIILIAGGSVQIASSEIREWAKKRYSARMFVCDECKLKVQSSNQFFVDEMARRHMMDHLKGEIVNDMDRLKNMKYGD